MTVPFLELARETQALRAELEAAFARVLNRGRFILDAELECFEREWAAFCGARAGVGTGNGTQALEIALRALGLKPGEEVITTPLTAAFTGLAIIAAGGTPVFADVESESLLLDPESVARRITPRTRAIIPVHLYGRLANLEAFRDLGRKHGLEIVQDACQAHGATFACRPLTHWSRAVAYSFYPTKNLGALGDGGALVTDDPEMEAAARLLRNGGIGDRYGCLRPDGDRYGRLRPDGDRYGRPRPDGAAAAAVSERAAINSRLDELQAALLRAKLPHLARWNEQRRALAAEYARRGIAPAGGLPATAGEHVFHLYVIREARRTELCAALSARGIGCAIHYPVPLHLQPTFAASACPVGSLPAAELACRQILSLPLNPFLSIAEIEQVCQVITEFRQNRDHG